MAKVRAGEDGNLRSVRGRRVRICSVAALFALAASSLFASLVSVLVIRAAQQHQHEAIDAALSALPRALALRTARLYERLDGFERRLSTRGGETPDRLVEWGGAAGHEVVALAADLGLDVLFLLDSAGVVVAASHWPELVGLSGESLEGVSGSVPAVAQLAVPEGSRLAFLGAREVDWRGRRMVVVGGWWLGQEFLEEAAGGAPAVLFDFGESSSRPVLTTSGATLDRNVCSALARLDGDQAVQRVWHDVHTGVTWDLGRAALGRRAGVLILGVDRSWLVSLRERLERVLVTLVLSAMVGGLLAGAWVAWRVELPVKRLTRAVDAIAEGREDYAFPGASGDEVTAIAGSFSRLQRALARQRQHSAAAERVAAWREVARHVAHEVKNPLAPIRLTVENLRRARSCEPAAFDALFEEGMDTIREEVDQLTRLVGEFSEFARLPPPDRRRIDFTELIRGVVELFRGEPGIDLHCEVPEAVFLEADPDQLARVLKNLLANAIEALRQRHDDGLRRIDVVLRVDGEWTVVAVGDNGPGIPPALVSRVFEPYFTTKPQGTGLGMAIVHRILHEHGGSIEVENRTEGGTLVRLRLPSSTDPTGEA